MRGGTVELLGSCFGPNPLRAAETRTGCGWSLWHMRLCLRPTPPRVTAELLSDSEIGSRPMFIMDWPRLPRELVIARCREASTSVYAWTCARAAA